MITLNMVIKALNDTTKELNIDAKAFTRAENC